MIKQAPCPCFDCNDLDTLGGCAASEWQSTGPCLTEDCTCYGTEVDDGLCEGCYISTK
jgi:hypothetical protein